MPIKTNVMMEFK